MAEVGSGKSRILIVDDDREMVNAIKRVLVHKDKYELAVAYDGNEALVQLANFSPDLVLLDMRMPELDGLAFCEKVRQSDEYKDVKIVVVSGALDMDVVAQLMEIGANDYLTKPFRNEFLLMLVERVLSS